MPAAIDHLAVRVSSSHPAPQHSISGKTAEAEPSHAIASTRTHVALVRPEYVRAIIDGVKTIESRLSMHRRAPFGCVAPGDTLFVVATATGGPRMACVAHVSRVLSVEGLSPRGVVRLQRSYNQQIRGESAYWQSKRGAKYATLVWLNDVREVTTYPAYAEAPGASPRGAWFCVG